MLTFKISLNSQFIVCPFSLYLHFAPCRYHEPDGAGEDWWTAIYVSIITASSVGYGDFSFTTPWGRACGIINTLVGVLLCARYIGNIADLVIDMQASRVYEKKLRRAIKPADILRMDDGDDGEVDRLEFLCAYLVNLGKVCQRTFTLLGACTTALLLVGFCCARGLVPSNARLVSKAINSLAWTLG